MVQEMAFLHEDAHLLSIDQVSEILKVFCDLLVSIAANSLERGSSITSILEALETIPSIPSALRMVKEEGFLPLFLSLCLE